MQKFAPYSSTLAFVLAAVLHTAPIAAVGAEDVDADAGADAVDAPEAGAEKAPIPGGPDDENALWWNDPKIVKDLSLTDEQRQKMSQLLQTYRANVAPNPQMDTFHETLVQGSWKEARAETEKLAAAAGTSVRMRGALKIDVLSLLSKEQLANLVDRYPRLIYQRWRRAMRGAPAR
jgi:Spy/CpxP family protein refolding chaperone